VLNTTELNDVSPNIDRTQAAEIVPGSDGMVPSAAAWRHLQQARSIPTLPGVTGVHSAFFVPSDLDLWPWHSKSSERGTKHVIPVNLTQIHWAVPEILFWVTNKQTKQTKKVTDSA